MADRFPLILNTDTNQIQEIPSGDNLDLTGSGIHNAGIITATSFSGPIVAGAGTSNIVAGIITATQIDLNGDIDVDGHTNLDNVSVGGATTTTGILNITANTGSTNTTSGALRVAGGAGIQGSVNIGESVNIDADLDVDGHTNLDNLSVAGVTTMSGNLTISNTLPSLFLTDTNNNDDYSIQNQNGYFAIKDESDGHNRLVIHPDGKNVIGGDLDVDGHTNLDNISISGVSTFGGTINGASADFAGQIQVGTNNSKFGNNYLRFENAGIGYFDHNGTGQNINFRVSNSSSLDTTPLVVKAAGIDVTGNITATGNVSVGGVLTYEDVTNVDSVGIVTARSGLRVTGGTSNFSGTSHFVGIARFNETIVGTARTAIKLTCTDESTDTTTYPLFVAATTGDQFPKTGTNLSFNSANGTLTATTFSGSGASLTSLPAANLTGTAAAINGSNITNVNADTVDGVHASQFLRGDATSTFNCNGYNLSFDFDTSGRDSINFTQSGSLRFQLVHDNSGNDIDIVKHGSAANIKIAGNRILTTADEGTGNGLDADTVDGIQGSNIVTLSGTQTVAGTKTFNCSGYDYNFDYDNTRTLIRFQRSSSEILKFHTQGDAILISTAGSGSLRWETGLIPLQNDTYDLGTTALRWSNLYVNDLQLSNESKKDKGGNDVDGTWGDWTLQEGDENIFMLNNRTGKKYKMNLTEVE